MIEINEEFTVPASPDEVYAVMSDPHAVVECVAGAALKEQNPDGTYDGTMTVKFSALRVNFAGRISLELEPGERSGTVVASGRDGQGGTKFRATAHFTVGPDGDEGAKATVNGEVALNGKLAGVIENAATAVVRRMTGEFVEALSMRCASSATVLGPRPAREPAVPGASDEAAASGATPGQSAAGATGEGTVHRADTDGPAQPATPPAAVLLLHDFGSSPGAMRPWGEALAARGLAVSIPRLPGHGTRWKDLHRTGAQDWSTAARAAFAELRASHSRVFVMGLGLGATLALELAEQRGEDLAGVVAVNPLFSAPQGVPRAAGLVRLLRRSVTARPDDIRKPGAGHAGYDRMSLRAVGSLVAFGTAVRAGLGAVTCPVLVATSTTDHVARPADAATVARAFSAERHRRVVYAESYHYIPLDHDAPRLFEESAEFVHSHALVSRP